MKTCRRTCRHGMTLVEMMAALAITASLMASSVVLVRTSYSMWQAHQADAERVETACGVVRHVVRSVRQAAAITAISPATEINGHLSLLTDGGETWVWSHDAGTGEVRFGMDTAGDVLAGDIDAVVFRGYEANGITATTVVADIHVVECLVRTTLPTVGGETRTVSSRAWLRSW